MQAVSPEDLVALHTRLFQAIQDSEECSVCFDTLNNPRILPCSHYFCCDCIREVRITVVSSGVRRPEEFNRSSEGNRCALWYVSSRRLLIGHN